MELGNLQVIYCTFTLTSYDLMIYTDDLYTPGNFLSDFF